MTDKIPYTREAAIQAVSQLDFESVVDSIDFEGVSFEEIEQLMLALQYASDYYAAQAQN